MTNLSKIGQLGENIAVKYLKNRGFLIIEQNFLRKYGEIDIICEKDGKLHFFEVKSVSRITSQEVNNFDEYRPEDNLHGNKAKRLKRVITTYLSAYPDQKEFLFHLITIKINQETKTARVGIISDVIL